VTYRIRASAVCLAASTAVLSLAPLRAGTINMITNGGFESGLSGWTASSTVGGDTAGSCESVFAAQTAATGCVTGYAPVYGSYAAYASDSFPAIANNSGQYTFDLAQTFTLPGSFTGAVLSFSASAVGGASGTYDGATVEGVICGTADSEYSCDGPSLNTGLIPAQSFSLNWATQTQDLTSFLQAYEGNSVTLYLEIVSNYDTTGDIPNFSSSADYVIGGFDNVSLEVTTPGGAPEPGTVVLFGLAMGLFAVWRMAAGPRFARATTGSGASFMFDADESASGAPPGGGKALPDRP